ncbi:ModD protein [Hydrogenimonas thermophila]|uniref:ModD protein n=1 Tax=Hydrogenimonas thermophila TaxID=223786 RepID=UPI002936E27A|nr:ModD protein [Hydrogenimonas thermophila]WOE70226.1 ModD protein [Hydrogenimonas thermophila]WOE72743.1 ModD protein [Hydrogenimonas thermophila]
MIHFTEYEIDSLIEEDLPYFDLTTDSLGIGNIDAVMTFTAREDLIVSCSEEVARILRKVGVHYVEIVSSGKSLKRGEVIVKAEGKAGSLHRAWKVCQNILEYACGIATYTNLMVKEAGSVPLFTTRKSQPGFKKIALKSVMSGGAHPHRLGLSETFLIFKNHRNLLDEKVLLKRIRELQKSSMAEKQIAVEVDSFEDALTFAKIGVCLFQLEKFPVKTLLKVVSILKENYPDIRLFATGGIKLENVKEYATAGVDGVITTAPFYYANPADIKVNIETI